MFVAEAKFRKQTEQYSELIRRQDSAAILDLLTDRAVELKVQSAAWMLVVLLVLTARKSA